MDKGGRRVPQPHTGQKPTNAELHTNYEQRGEYRSPTVSHSTDTHIKDINVYLETQCPLASTCSLCKLVIRSLSLIYPYNIVSSVVKYVTLLK